jgi:hypothetical protein
LLKADTVLSAVEETKLLAGFWNLMGEIIKGPHKAAFKFQVDD